MGHAAVVQLRDLFDATTYDLPLSDLEVAAGHCSWEAVPRGDYKAWFIFAGSSHWVPREAGNDAFPVGPGGASLHFDLRGLRSLEIRLVDRRGRAFQGEAAVELSRIIEGEQASEFVQFRRAPYRIDGIPPQEYELAVYSPFYVESIGVPRPGAEQVGWLESLEIREP